MGMGGDSKANGQGQEPGGSGAVYVWAGVVLWLGRGHGAQEFQLISRFPNFYVTNFHTDTPS